jgi:hypothetical protein
MSHVNGTSNIPTKKLGNFFLKAYSLSAHPNICIIAIYRSIKANMM